MLSKFDGIFGQIYSIEKTRSKFLPSLAVKNFVTKLSIIYMPLIINVFCYASQCVTFHLLNLWTYIHNYHSIVPFWILNLLFLSLADRLHFVFREILNQVNGLQILLGWFLGFNELGRRGYAKLVSWDPHKNGFYVRGRRSVQNAGPIMSLFLAVSGSIEIGRRS